MNDISVMLVDDDILAIDDLKTMIDWQESGFNIVAETTNPKKGIELYHRLHPQIIIVDIRMPIMDGIAFSKEILSLNSNVKILLLSSYKDFECAKQAIKIGVSGYILKHEINNTKLLEELSILKTELLNDTRNKSTLRRQILQDLLSNRVFAVEELLKIEKEIQPAGCNFVLFLLGIDTPFPIYNIESVKESMLIDTSEWGNGLSDSNIDCITILTLGESKWAVLFILKKGASQRQVWESTYRMAYSLQRDFKEQSHETLTVVISMPFNSITEISINYRNLESIYQHAIFFGREKILRQQDFQVLQPSENTDVSGHMTTISQALEKMNIIEVTKTLDAIFSCVALRHNNITTLKEVTRELVFILDSFRKKHILPSIARLIDEGRVDMSYWFYIGDIHKWFVIEFNHVLEDIKSLMAKKYSIKVSKALEFIEANYSKTLVIEDIAEEVGISAAHLRLKVKEETGKTILEYITELRIEKAKVLLKSGKYKIYEVAEMVGYGTSQYFSQIFKKNTQTSPFDYLEGKESKDENKN